MTGRRIVFAVILAVILLPALAMLVLWLTFDPNAYAPRIVAAVENATGRQLVLGSPLKMSLSLTPSIEADNVSLSNPPGFPDADFLTLQKLQARIALLPLLSHRLDIEQLVLTAPTVTLESTGTGPLVLTGPTATLKSNATGQNDWDFTKAGSPVTPESAPQAAQPAAGGYQVTLESVTVQNGLVVLKSPKGVQIGALSLQTLTGTADSALAPLNINATATYNGAPFTLTGQLGPVARFSGIGSGPWPVALTFAANGATATLNGAAADPRDFSGYQFTAEATIPALEAFQPWLGQIATLPPIHNLTLTAQLADQNAVVPAITNLSFKTGASDLSSFRPGLSIQSLDLEMKSLNQPVSLNLAGTLNNAPLTLAGTIGPPAFLLNPAWLPAAAAAAANPQAPPPIDPVNLTLQAAGAQIALTGGLATPEAVAGAALGVTATIPDLSQLSPLAGTPLPTWKNIALQTTITDPGGLGLTKAIGLTSLTYKMDNLAFGGDISVYFGSQQKLDASLKAQQFNLDAVLAALPAPPPSSAAPPTTQTATDITQSTAVLPIKFLQTASADIELEADTFIFHDTTYTAPQIHAVLANGVLTLSPATAILPGGSVSATASIDATKTPPAETLTITAPALALRPFLKTIGLPDDAQGTIQANLNATAAGATPHDAIASLNGQLGLASVNGELDGTVLDSMFAPVLRTIGLPAGVLGAQGPIPVRCFALRVDAADGIGTIRALTLDSSRLAVQGGGTISLPDEMLNVVLRPDLKFAGAAVGVPVQISGPIGDPSYKVAPLSVVQQAAKSALGLPADVAQHVASDAAGTSIFGQITNTLGLTHSALGNTAAKLLSPPDVCPAALALGRLGAPGPAAESPAALSNATKSKTNGPQNLLNALFGK